MELWCIVPNESQKDFQILEKEGLNPSLFKGYMEGKFPTIHGGVIHNMPITTHYFIKNWEYGGGMTNTGKATIVCGMHGEKLKPKKIFTTGHLANKIHAEFETSYGHEITCTKSGDTSIIYYYLAFIHDSVNIQTQSVWEGPHNSVPNKYKTMKPGIFTAYKKANEYHCRRALYVRPI